MKTITMNYKGEAKIIKLDDDDFDRLSGYKYFYGKRGYAIRNSWDGKKRFTFPMHREIMNFPEGMDVDHINHDKLDNRKENLRVCTKMENGRNVSKKKNNKSGYIGVYRRTDISRYGKKYTYWTASIEVSGKKIYLGSNTNNPAELARRYNEAAIKYFGKYAVLNDVPEVYFYDI